MNQTEKALNLIANADYLHQLEEIAVWVRTLPLSPDEEAHVNDAITKRCEELEG